MELRPSDGFRTRTERAISGLRGLFAGRCTEADQAVDGRRSRVVVLDRAETARFRPVVLDKHRRILGGPLQLESVGLASRSIKALLLLLRCRCVFRIELSVLNASLRQWGQRQVARLLVEE